MEIEKDYELVSKGIAFGSGMGIIVGATIGDVILFFSLGGVIGILTSIIISIIKKVKRRS